MLELHPSPRGPVADRLHFRKLGYCPEHKRTVTLPEILSDEAFGNVVRTLREAGKAKIDRGSTTLVWERLSRGDEKRLARQQHRTFSVPETEEELAF